jgi:hypothetical protein
MGDADAWSSSSSSHGWPLTSGEPDVGCSHESGGGPALTTAGNAPAAVTFRGRRGEASAVYFAF